MSATAAPANIKVTVEGDVQVLYCTIAAVADTNTTDFSGWSKNILNFLVTPQSKDNVVSGTVSAGIITWQVSTGTPNIYLRLAFQ